MRVGRGVAVCCALRDGLPAGGSGGEGCRCMWLGLDDWEWDDQHTWLLLLFGSFQIFLALAAPVESGCTSAAGMGL